MSLRRQCSGLLRVVKGKADPPAADAEALDALLAMFGCKLTRAQRSERNKRRWGNGDRTAWGGEDRRGWPKHPGRNGYRYRRAAW